MLLMAHMCMYRDSDLLYAIARLSQGGKRSVGLLGMQPLLPE